MSRGNFAGSTGTATRATVLSTTWRRSLSWGLSTGTAGSFRQTARLSTSAARRAWLRGAVATMSRLAIPYNHVPAGQPGWSGIVTANLSTGVGQAHDSDGGSVGLEL